jgi:hypothetical protein
VTSVTIVSQVPEDDPATEQLKGLSELERDVLSALAVVGETSLAPTQIETLLGVDDVRAAVEELRRRGLVESDEEDRVAAAPGLRDRLSKAWNVVDTGDRVLQQLISIAEDGRLNLDDLDAVLGITEWACGLGRFEQLLRLVHAVQTTVDVVHRAETWLQILGRAREAAEAVGDVDAEAWVEAERRRVVRATRGVRRVPSERRSPARLPNWVVRGVVPVALVGAGFGIATVLGGGSSDEGGGATAVTAPARTVSLAGTTVTAAGTVVTVPPTTVTVPGTTVTIPEVTTVTTTVTVQAGGPTVR